MKTKLKIAAAMLAFLMLASAFSGCAGSGTETGTGTESSSAVLTDKANDGDADKDAGEGEKLAEPLLLAEGSKTIYRLIRADQTSDGVIELYKSFSKAVKAGGLKTYGGETDWVKAGTDVDSKKEILIGYTSRPESETVMKTLNFNDFAIEILNNKVVIAAHNEKKLTEAMTYLISNLLKFEEKDGTVSVYLTGTYTSRSEGTDCFCGGTLAECTIIYPHGNIAVRKIAQTLQEAIKNVYGFELETAPDNTVRTGNEIVIGSTDRPISSKFAGMVNALDYVAAADGGDLAIIGNTATATEKAVEDFIKKYVNKYYTYGLSLEEDFCVNASVYSFKTDPARAEGTDFRVMSFNLLCELWDAKVAIAGRDDAAFAAISYYTPDVVGLQEVSDGWYTALDKLFGTEYAFTDRTNTQGKTNFSTLAYNTETLTLLDHGVRVFSKGNDSRLRLATWGYFEIKASGKKFIAVSTHWDLSKNTEYQLIHSKEMGELVLELGKKYNCAVVTTGDYNSNEESAPYQNFVADTGYKDAKYSAAVVADAGKTTHSLYADVTEGTACIDHIFGSDKLSFLYFNILKDKTVIDASDHCPIYADVKLK